MKTKRRFFYSCIITTEFVSAEVTLDLIFNLVVIVVSACLKDVGFVFFQRISYATKLFK